MIKKVDNEALKIIANNLGDLYKAGINIEVAFEILEEMIPNKHYKEALKDIRLNIKKGVSLGECFKKHSLLFPSIFCQFIILGEKNGQLEKVLDKLSIFYTKVEGFRRKIKNMFIYPKILIVSCILISIFCITTVVPQIANIYDSSNGELPSFVGLLNSFSILLKENLAYAISLIFSYGIILCIIFKILNIKSKLMNSFKKSKIFKLYYEQNIIFILYIIFSSGNSLEKDLKIMQYGYDDAEIKSRIDEILKFINKGESLISYFKDENYSIATYNMIKLGYETGGLEEKLDDALNRIEEELENSIQKYVGYIQPVSMGIIGVFIAFIMLSTLMPMFSAIGVL